MANITANIGFLNSQPDKHSLSDDIQGMATGSIVAALGFYILNQVGVLTGGTAGVAFLLHYGFGFSFGLMFFLVNLPFYALSIKRMGWVFSLKTLLAITLVSLITEVESRWMVISQIQPLWGSILGGLLLGYGVLALYRHRASLGGIGIVALYLQEQFGIRAGLVQLAFDSCVMLCAFFVLEPVTVFYSLIGAVVLNMFLAINHRSDRYIAVR